jgi:hypothetical protein
MHLRHALITSAALASFAALSLPAAAQNSVPSYATGGGETIHGTIASVNGGELSLRDDRGFVDRVAIHSHIVMHPVDLQLAADQSVTIVGHADGRVFIADEIDLAESGPGAYGDSGEYGAPGYDYAPAPYPYPYAYPVYPYYPYYGGPFFGASVGFYFGGGYGHYYPYGGYRGGYPGGGFPHGGYPGGGYPGGGFGYGGFGPHPGTIGGASRSVSAGGHGGSGGRR